MTPGLSREMEDLLVKMPKEQSVGVYPLRAHCQPEQGRRCRSSLLPAGVSSPVSERTPKNTQADGLWQERVIHKVGEQTGRRTKSASTRQSRHTPLSSQAAAANPGRPGQFLHVWPRLLL